MGRRGHWERAPASVGALLLASVLGAATPPLPEKPTRYLTDRASVFSPDRAGALNERLAAFERETSNQVIVYVDRSLPPGTSLEELGAAALRQWGVGQAGKSNGVIFFVFTDERVMRLEVGYGLEGILPDARARQITSGVVKPLFKSGDYAGGIEAGVDAVLAAVRAEALRGTGKTVAEASGAHAETGLLVALAALGVLLALVGILHLARRRSTSVTGSPPAGGVRSFGPGPSGGSASPSSSDVSGGGQSVESPSAASSDFSGGGGDSGGGGSSDSW